MAEKLDSWKWTNGNEPAKSMEGKLALDGEELKSQNSDLFSRLEKEKKELQEKLRQDTEAIEKKLAEEASRNEKEKEELANKILIEKQKMQDNLEAENMIKLQQQKEFENRLKRNEEETRFFALIKPERHVFLLFPHLAHWDAPPTPLDMKF